MPLTESQVSHLRDLRTAGATYAEIAQQMGITTGRVFRALNPEKDRAYNKKRRAYKNRWQNARRAPEVEARRRAWIAFHEPHLRPGELPVYRYKEVVAYTKVDPEIWDRYKHSRLSFNPLGYAVLSRDGLSDGTRHAQNSQNRIHPNSRTGLRGVIPTRHGTFTANAMLDGVTHYLGTFSTAQDAHQAVSKWRAEHMPFSPDAAEGKAQIASVQV